MNAVPTTATHTGLFETTGIVKATCNGVFDVQTTEGSFHAIRAFSCLVAPEDGDVVIIAGPAAGQLYLLAILERTGCTDTRLSTDGNLTVELQTGRFTVCATDGVDLISKKAVTVVADRVEAHAREGAFLMRNVTMVAATLDATLDRLSQTAKRVYRRITELDHARAGQIDYAATGTMKLHGENTLMSATNLVKADGKQIHIG